jgi:hypothetical protein
MKIPEKLYYAPYGDIREGHPITDNDIEYIRKDVFIEKVCEWIETNMDDYIHVEYDTVTGKPTNEAHIAHKKVIDDIRKYMER